MLTPLCTLGTSGTTKVVSIHERTLSDPSPSLCMLFLLIFITSDLGIIRLEFGCWYALAISALLRYWTT